MTSLEAAILRTVLYADVFHFPLTIAEIRHFLIAEVCVSPIEIETALQESPVLQEALIVENGFVACADRTDLFERRKKCEDASQALWSQAVRYGTWLGRLPFVRMVALTGALAMRNAAAEGDDLDYILVTAPNRVWLARAFAIVLVRAVKLRGVVICPNYVLAENALEQGKQDLFIAHEIAQMIPLYGHSLYWQFRATNAWTHAQLPNAQEPFYTEPDYATGRVWGWIKASLEMLLSGGVGDWLERWEYRRKLNRFAADMQTPGSAAQLDEHRVKGHFNDYGHPVLRQYAQKLREFGLEETERVQ